MVSEGVGPIAFDTPSKFEATTIVLRLRDAQRTADAPAGVSPRDQYIRLTADAWKTPPVMLDAGLETGAPTRAMETVPAGAYCKVGLGANENDVVSWNGSPARLVKRGGWLFPVPIDVGATRSGRSSGGAPPTRNDSMTADQAQVVRNQAYQQYCSDLENAWRT
jgi:hypothetical protein